MKNQILLNEDNAIATLSRVSIKTKKSEKTGNLFTILTLYFKNGLEIDYFVDKKDIFGIKDAVSRLSNGQKIESILNEEDSTM